MLEDNKPLENHENLIRNHLYKDYLNNNSVRENLGLLDYIFHIENPFVDNEYKESGRNDIQVYNIFKFSENTDAYFIIECKRLENTNNGKGSLNYEYAKEGIERFKIREDYPSFFGINGMIGFIIKKLNINEMIYSINQLLEDSEKLTKFDKYEKFEYPDITFYSEHSDYKNTKLELYHLMFDFSSIII